MKKRLWRLCLTFILLVGMAGISVSASEASEDHPVIDGSYLTHKEESIGYNTKISRGEDLLMGYSKCARLGPEKLYAGGTTIAAHEVTDIGVGVMVERIREGEEEWSYYDSWNEFLENTDRIASAKILDVEGGYYYRVNCVHSAGEDVSSSFTDGIFIEEDSIFP